ncbi:MAG: hypothetical protein OHK0036_07330 [Bacteroidia bacterium]
MNQQSSEEQWQELKLKIEESQQFPSIYMFKFILNSDNQKIAQIEAIFNNTNEHNISIRESSRGRYVSITIKQMVENADYIITIYKKVSEIPGVMLM